LLAQKAFQKLIEKEKANRNDPLPIYSEGTYIFTENIFDTMTSISRNMQIR